MTSLENAINLGYLFLTYKLGKKNKTHPVVAIKAPVITRSRLPHTMIVPGSTFVAPPKTLLGTWHDEYNIILW